MRQAILLFILTVLFAMLLLAFSEAPSFTDPLMAVADYYVKETVPKVGATNIVSAVTFDWRGFDTFGEATLLLTAAVGIRLLLRHWQERRRRTGWV